MARGPTGLHHRMSMAAGPAEWREYRNRLSYEQLLTALAWSLAEEQTLLPALGRLALASNDPQRELRLESGT